MSAPTAPVAAHALLSASGAHRWKHCTPSARLEATLPEKNSVYADEGRLAHEIGELKLRKQFIEPMSARVFASRLKKLKDDLLYEEEMLRYTDVYVEYIAGVVHSYSAKPYVAVEKRLDFSAYVPEGFGTGDCIIIGGKTLHVIDFKYGKGVPVYAEDNPQMMLYALGAYVDYSFLYGIETVKMVIMQPRLDNISEWQIQVSDLLAWGEELKPIAQKAFAGEGEFVPGDHCQFCRAKALCRARSEFNLGLEDYKFMTPPIISNEEVGAILQKAQLLAKWAKDLEEYALAECLAGNDIAGWKAVHGRSTRAFTDTDAAFKTLIATGTEEVMLYERKPITLTAVESLVGKKKFTEVLGSYIIKPPGKPTLVVGSDKREAISRSSAADDFKNENENGGNENE